VSQPKVVPINVAESQRSRIPPIINSVRQQAKRELTRLLDGLLDCTDDALFEMADRSQSDLTQHMYFDAMRQIRLHRQDVQKKFLREVYSGFERAFCGPNQNGTDEEGTEDAELGLVGNEDLEVSVAVSGIVSKITSRFSLAIMELTKRLDHLNKTREVSELSNPLGPRLLSEAFAHAIDQLDVDIRVRIILLKLFERLVMEQLGTLYQAANDLLIEAGILPDLRRTLGKGRTGRTSVPPATYSQPAGRSMPVGQGQTGTNSPGIGQGGGPAGGPKGNRAGASAGVGGGVSGGGTAGQGAGGGALGFGVIQNLLAAMRVSGSAPPVLPGPELDTSQLLNLLHGAQNELTGGSIDPEDVPPLLDLRQVVVARAPDITGEAINSLGRADDDVVNFIGMLFDYILNDRNLAIPMKALIARLQIPIVKLAIIDKAFFEKGGHPARQLLNELSSAGIGWSSAAELKRDATYNKIESVVLQVLNGFTNNPDIFQELLEDLRAFQNREYQRSQRVEDRIKQTETGKAKTTAAKLAAQKLINQKACGLRLPRMAGRFLSEVWSKVLIYACLTSDSRSESWNHHVKALDDLLWCLQPLTNLDDVARREELIADLVCRLGKGMSELKLPDAERERWKNRLTSQLAEVSQCDRAYLEDDAAPAPGSTFEAVEEIVLTSADDLPPEQAGDAARPEFIEKIKTLREGVWVELIDPQGQLLRCKLAAIVKPGERCIFVNRRGMKVAERSRMQLAMDLQEEKLTVLNDSQVFDRALQAVIGNLRELQGNG